jgi:hypothetical protein
MNRPVLELKDQRRYFVALAVSAVLAASIISSNATAVYAHDGEECPRTLDTLADCVTHHWEDGEIYSDGVYKSLISKVNAAVQARDNGNTDTAVNILEAFINQVQAQDGKKIAPEAAEHMVHHATEAIEKLES